MDSHYDVVIVGAGIAGPIIAKQLGAQGRTVLLLESGPTQPPTERAGYLDTFFANSVKTPESPYPPLNGSVTGRPPAKPPSEQAVPRATVADTFANNVNPGFADGTNPTIYNTDASYLVQEGPLPFLSTYERLAGGTTWHWLGTSLRFLEHDFTMESTYGVMTNWPEGVFQSLVDTYYNKAEDEIGVSANKATQEAELGSIGLEYAPQGYQYPMQAIPTSLVDDAVRDGLKGAPPFCEPPEPGPPFCDFAGLPVEVTPTPAGRNSQPRGQRRVCAGNTNCIPICPIQAKYDGTVSISDALQSGNVTLIAQAVANKVHVDGDGRVSGIDYITWDDAGGTVAPTGSGTATGTLYVLAAHALETPKLLLMSADPDKPALANGVGNSSGLVGANFMDHPLYLSWGLMEDDVWGFRGPLTTAGIESLRDGPFRSDRAAWRVEIGNEGWNFSIGDPWTSTLDMIRGTNVSQLNDAQEILFGDALVAKLNGAFPRQWRMGFLVEQTPDTTNRITLSRTLTDGLGLPRPVVNYDLSEYTRRGFVYAEIFARQVYQALGARCYTQNPKTQDVMNPDGTVARTVRNPAWFPMEDEWVPLFENLPPALKAPEVTNLPASANGIPEGFQYFGSGHLVGTYTMGDDPGASVVDADQRSHDHPNLFMVGSGVFPTITTANPTLTLAALAFRAADAISAQLGAA